MPIREIASTRQKSLWFNAYGRKMECITQTKDLTDGAYDCKMHVRHVTSYLQLLMALFLLLYVVFKELSIKDFTEGLGVSFGHHI